MASVKHFKNVTPILQKTPPYQAMMIKGIFNLLLFCILLTVLIEGSIPSKQLSVREVVKAS
jgi:hypothetical protein